MSRQAIALVTLVVDDYDDAIDFYVNKVGFELIEDLDQPGKRWVVIAPPGSSNCQLLLAQAKNDQEQRRIGDQTGGRVAFFLQTDDFVGDYQRMLANGVCFCEEPRHEAYGTVAVFEDLYGNQWDLLEPRAVPS